MAIFHCPIKIIQRSRGRSAVAAAAYRSGTKLTNQWDGLTHDFTRKGGVVHTEIMLPVHAPPDFSDRSTLWNSMKMSEKSKNSQLALVRSFVKDNFVDSGMCADFAIHDKGTGNPHAHIMLTIRPLKENGEWGAKCRKVYELDKNGQRIPDGKGSFKSHREDTTDWNDRGKAEEWRAAWAAYANNALEAAGRPERIDHRSYKRQGIDKIPTIHMGVAASQMEKRGVSTRKGNLNRQIAADNKLLKEIKARITRLYNWTKEQAVSPKGKESIMAQLCEAHLSGQGKIVTAEKRLKVLDEYLSMWEKYEKHKSVRRQSEKMKPGSRKEKFDQDHRAELALYEAAARYLDKLKAIGEPIVPKKWKTESEKLTVQKELHYQKMRAMREQIKAVESLRKAAEQMEKGKPDRDGKKKGREL